MQLTPEQQSAVESSLAAPLTMVTGGPGTGKTTTMREVVDRNRAAGARVMLMAPTGKAASRIAAQTGFPACTVHRALEWVAHQRRFERDASNPIAADVIVVDECSMLDVVIAARLFDAIRADARVVLVGDRNQLEPVGPGSVFAEGLDLPGAPVVTLRRPFRQEAGSAIADAAQAILEGRVPASSPRFDPAGCFFVSSVQGSENVVAAAVSLVTERIPKVLGPDAVVQVLTARRQEALVSAQGLNAALAPTLNPGAPAVGFWPKDRVIQLVNDYDHGVFNGDNGVVFEVTRDGSVIVDFETPDGPVKIPYPPNMQTSIARSFAVTTHKAQGSEYPAVVVVLDDASGPLLHRKLLYTAVTRAQRVCCVIGTLGAVERAVKTLSPSRNTHLRARVEEALAAGESPPS